MEKLPKIEQQVNSQDNSRRFENLEEEIMDCQFQYIEKVDSGELELPENDKKENFDFSDMLKKYTSVCNHLEREFYKRAEKVDSEKFNYDQGYFAGCTVGRIYELYEKDKKNWKDGVSKIVNDSIEKLGEVKRDINRNENKRAGLINFNVHKIEELSEFGFNENDDFLSIHFDKLYNQKESNDSIKNIFSEILSKLASLIVKEYPQVKAITAKSWLLDSPIGKRIGFNITKRYEGVTSNDGFWGQFITEDGKLNKEKMQKFLSSGRADFYPAKGYIKTEDFLRKYLPKEERVNPIKLKSRTEESINFEKGVNDIVKKVKSNWMNMSFDEIFTILNSNNNLSDYFKTKDGGDFIEMMKAFKYSGLKSMDDFVYDHKDDINQKFKDFMIEKTNVYEEKEVLIQ